MKGSQMTAPETIGDVLDITANEEITAEVEKEERKPRKEKLTLNLLLANSCGDPDNFRHFENWKKKNNELPKDEKTEYFGWQRFEIQLHCLKVVVIAKKNPNGGYHIKDYVAIPH